MSRHGKVVRTPISSASEAELQAPHRVSPPPMEPMGCLRESADRDELHRLAVSILDRPTRDRLYRQRQSLDRSLDWLESLPGDNWQDRWLISGAIERDGTGWGPQGLSSALRERYTHGLTILIVLRVICPTHDWLSGSKLTRLYAEYRKHNHQQSFLELSAAGLRHGGGERAAIALNLTTRIVILTGKDPRDLGLADIQDYALARRGSRRQLTSLGLAYEMLHELGALKGYPPTYRQATVGGQLTVPELVDRYDLVNRDVRDLLVHYLLERSAALDYNTLVNQVHVLARLFWADLEQHHPGIDSLRLTPEMSHAWKQRLHTRTDGKPRRGAQMICFSVRAFYLDLQQWALQDPARWGRWVATSPIGEADLRGYNKTANQRRARMQDRTRSLVPVLPRLVAAAETQLSRSFSLLEETRRLQPGDEFTFDGTRYKRCGEGKRYFSSTGLQIAPIELGGKRIDVEKLEAAAFWTWAAIEVLRRTGARIEELLEVTHVSIRQYQTPSGEVVPLLQISPSKTDRERVIPADPELVAVLARIIRRVKDQGGRVPLLSRYDQHERTFGPGLPHLFQRVVHQRLEVISPSYIRNLIASLAKQAGITDVDGSQITFTPHDFRRIFSTETVNGGLPIHIAAKVLGHLDLNTTQGYVAVYPEQVIAHYRRFVEQRRAQRPGEEYREPTDTEWDEFRDHFSLRQVALGRCDRPYGTPCQHEHACIRCPMLRLDITQIPRLLQIETNHHERLDEARRMQWLGEVAAIEEGLRHIGTKKQQASRLLEQQQSGATGPDALG